MEDRAPTNSSKSKSLASSFEDIAERRIAGLVEATINDKKPRDMLKPLATSIQRALNEGVPKEALFREISKAGYTGSRSGFLYYLNTHLKKDLYAESSKNEEEENKEENPTQLKKPPRKTAKKATKKTARRKSVSSTVQSSSPRKDVFKETGTEKLSEFDRRLQRAQKGKNKKDK